MEKLLLSGEPGVGKSTVLSKLYEKYPFQIVGVIARNLRDAQKEVKMNLQVFVKIKMGI